MRHEYRNRRSGCILAFNDVSEMVRQPRLSPRKQPRQARAREAVDAILEATARILAREGTSAATTNRIAEVAGVSIGSLYQYFPNKESLFTALRNRHYDELEAMAEELPAMRSWSLREVLRRGAELSVAVHRADPALHVALDEAVPAQDVDRNRKIEDRLHQLLRAMLRERHEELRVGDPDLAAFVLVHAGEGIVHGAVTHAPELLTGGQLVDEIVDFAYRYLAR